MPIIENLVAVYFALIVVVILHEIGHLPQYIDLTFYYGLPRAVGINSYSQYGGLIMNAFTFIMIAYYNPMNLTILLVGAISWLVFIGYSILGSFNEDEGYDSKTKTYSYDDVPNKLWYIFVPLGIIAFLMFKGYYLPILNGVLG